MSTTVHGTGPIDVGLNDTDGWNDTDGTFDGTNDNDGPTDGTLDGDSDGPRLGTSILVDTGETKVMARSHSRKRKNNNEREERHGQKNQTCVRSSCAETDKNVSTYGEAYRWYPDVGAHDVRS